MASPRDMLGSPWPPFALRPWFTVIPEFYFYLFNFLRDVSLWMIGIRNSGHDVQDDVRICSFFEFLAHLHYGAGTSRWMP
jgi:hypothetical protein